MATAPKRITPGPNTGGLSTLQELYDLINGQTETTSGGTTTVTESGQFSPEAMNAMLKSALESNTGLAAVSMGQRTAGGYSSATNRLLTNDLLTRTAGQLAQLNTTKTKTATAPTQTVTRGGVTAGGAFNTAAFLGGLEFLNKSGGSEWLRKNVFGEGSAATNTDAGIFQTPSQAGSSGFGGVGSDPSVVSPVFNSPTYDSYNYTEFDTPLAPMDSGGGSNYTEFTPSPDTFIPMTYEDKYNNYTEVDFADGGLVGAHPMVRMADGGGVEDELRKKQLGSFIGVQSNVVNDPRKGLIGGFGGSNPTQVISTNPAIPVAQEPAPQSGGDTASSPGVTEIGSGISGGVYNPVAGDTNIGGGDGNWTVSESREAANLGRGITAVGNILESRDLGNFGRGISVISSIPSLLDIVDRAGSGDLNRGDIGTVSNVLGNIANITRDTGLRDVATVGRLASSNSPGELAVNVLDAATGGLGGKVVDTAKGVVEGDVGAIINSAAAFNPILSAGNALSTLLGGPSLGNFVVTTIANQQEDPIMATAQLKGANMSGVDKLGRPTITDKQAAALAMGAAMGPPAPAGYSTSVDTSATDNPSTNYGDFVTNVANKTADPMQSLVNEILARENMFTPPADTTGQPTTPTVDIGSFDFYSGNYSSDSAGGGSSSGGDSGGGGMSNSGEGGETGGGGWADGTPGGVGANVHMGEGKVRGPGTPISDSVPARLSRDEYVLPADVVKLIGVDTLDEIVAKHHVPAAVQKLRNLAKMK